VVWPFLVTTTSSVSSNGLSMTSVSNFYHRITFDKYYF
jgi:hypothetical protein